jgi:F-type H+-transporting ATPase subunit b
MNINLTLIGQTVTFAVFVWFCMKFIWPPIVAALEARRDLIAEGLAAADRGKTELELSTKRAVDSLREAKVKAADIIAQAERHSAQIIEEAKDAAKAEGGRQLAAARADMEQEVMRAREQLRAQVAQLVIAAAEKVLCREVDAKAHADLLEAVKAEL